MTTLVLTLALIALVLPIALSIVGNTLFTLVGLAFTGDDEPGPAETDEDGDGHCRTCGAYAHYGLLCDRCRSDLAGVED